MIQENLCMRPSLRKIQPGYTENLETILRLLISIRLRRLRFSMGNTIASSGDPKITRRSLSKEFPRNHRDKFWAQKFKKDAVYSTIASLPSFPAHWKADPIARAPAPIF